MQFNPDVTAARRDGERCDCVQRTGRKTSARSGSACAQTYPGRYHWRPGCRASPGNRRSTALPPPLSELGRPRTTYLGKIFGTRNPAMAEGQMGTHAPRHGAHGAGRGRSTRSPTRSRRRTAPRGGGSRSSPPLTFTLVLFSCTLAGRLGETWPRSTGAWDITNFVCGSVSATPAPSSRAVLSSSGRSVCTAIKLPKR